ncbi:MAG: ATP-binding cassette domain-containing protein [bacterium]|nr:ATP-binding cassette domain-containing protein [Candidatus Margulisiibacteriota bacterium]
MVNLLEVKTLKKHFGPVIAVGGVDLAIEQGESLGLVGESGSGKTTLARMILGLIEPSSGTIFYNNVRDLRQEFQLVFQDPQTSLNPRIRIGEAIVEPILVHKLLPKEKVKPRGLELLDLVRLPASYYIRFPHELSGGERQRVGIARALASGPRFLILDEPVSALDVSIQVEVLNLLKEIKKKLSLTCLLIAHDLSVIAYMCDRVAVMEAGQIKEIGLTDAILKDPQHPYTKKLLASAF